MNSRFGLAAAKTLVAGFVTLLVLIIFPFG